MARDEAKTPDGKNGARRARAPRLSPDERREQLCRAALAVLAEHGLGHSNHSLVAARAGVSLPTMLHYYPRHAELIEAVLDHVADFLLDDIAHQVAATVSNPAQAVEEMLVKVALTIDAHQDVVRVWLDWSTATRNAAWPKYLAFRQKTCTIVEGLLRQGQGDGIIKPDLSVADAAQIIVGLAHMIAQMRFAGSDADQIRQIIHPLIASYLVRPA